MEYATSIPPNQVALSAYSSSLESTDLEVSADKIEATKTVRMNAFHFSIDEVSVLRNLKPDPMAPSENSSHAPEVDLVKM